MMSLFSNNHNGNAKSRFQVTPRSDIESELLEVISPSPSSPSPTSNGGDISPDLGHYSTLGGYFTEMEEAAGEKGHTHNNTITTTSTSSSSSFYNTIYKYNKLKQTQGASLDPTFFPLPYRRPSNLPHSVVGISFYNERVLVYNFLQRPTGLLAISYHIFVSLAVIYCLVLTIMSTSSGRSLCRQTRCFLHLSSFALT